MPKERVMTDDAIDYPSLVAFAEDNFLVFAEYCKNDESAEATLEALRKECGMGATEQ
jgi:hypothetical protein